MALFAEKCTSHVGLDPFDNHPACSDIHTQFQLSLFWKCIWIYSIVVSVHKHLNVKEGLQNNHTSQKKNHYICVFAQQQQQDKIPMNPAGRKKETIPKSEP